ncbi:MAG TPA: GNAT family N-acetyltransferase [Gemmatimonadaceae bacterium]
MAIEIRLLGRDDASVLANVAPDVFDHDVQAQLAAAFLADPRHHIVVALDDDRVIGFVSAVDYVHPDKPPELWVNEVGVSPDQRGAGVATRMLREMFKAGRALGCHQAWVLTERSNAPAVSLYHAAGGSESGAELVMFEFPLDDPDAAPGQVGAPHV